MPYITMSQLTINENFGSQMGNFAALYRLSRETGHRIVFLDSWTAGRGLKLLESFEGLPIEVVSFGDLSESDRRVSIINIDSSVVVDQKVLRLDGKMNYDLRGLFNSYRYWYLSGVRNDVIKLFKFKVGVVEKATELLYKVGSPGKEVVGVHVRRTDYLPPGGFVNLSVEYYREAFSFFSGKKYIFLVFSDDIDWCKKVFQEKDNVYYSDQLSPYVDMCAMSLCDHNIIANSAFSAWAAHLNKNVGKIVICPSRYFKEDHLRPYMNYSWFPDDWIAVNV